MTQLFAVIIFIGFVSIFFIGCVNKSEKNILAKYKLIEGEGASYIDPADTSLIKIYSNKQFEVWRKNTLAFKGKIEMSRDTLLFILDDKRKLLGVFEDTSHTI